MRRTESKYGRDHKGRSFDTRRQKVVSLALAMQQNLLGDGLLKCFRLCETEPVILT